MSETTATFRRPRAWVTFTTFVVILVSYFAVRAVFEPHYAELGLQRHDPAELSGAGANVEQAPAALLDEPLRDAAGHRHRGPILPRVSALQRRQELVESLIVRRFPGRQTSSEFLCWGRHLAIVPSLERRSQLCRPHDENQVGLRYSAYVGRSLAGLEQSLGRRGRCLWRDCVWCKGQCWHDDLGRPRNQRIGSAHRAG